MRKIWKYELDCNSIKEGQYVNEFKIHHRATPLTVMTQDNKACLWCETEESEPLDATLRVYVVGTGWGAVPAGVRYLGSVVMGSYVWHFYGELEKE